MSQVISNLRNKKLQKIRQYKKSEPSEEVKEKDHLLKSLQQQITGYKKDINKIKQAFDSVFNYDKIIKIQDAINDKIKKNNSLQQEVRAMGTVRVEQERALQDMAAKDTQKQKKQTLKQELASKKQIVSDMLKVKRLNDKRIKDQHTKMINLEERIRYMQFIIKKKDKKQRQSKNASEIRSQNGKVDYSQMTTQQIKKEFDLTIEEKSIKQNLSLIQINRIEGQYSQMELNNKKLQILIQEREQQQRLGQLKLRELRRKIPSKKLRPIVSKSLSKNKAILKSNQKLFKTPSVVAINRQNVKNNKITDLFPHPKPPIVPTLSNKFKKKKAIDFESKLNQIQSKNRAVYPKRITNIQKDISYKRLQMTSNQIDIGRIGGDDGAEQDYEDEDFEQLEKEITRRQSISKIESFEQNLSKKNDGDLSKLNLLDEQHDRDQIKKQTDEIQTNNLFQESKIDAADQVDQDLDQQQYQLQNQIQGSVEEQLNQKVQIRPQGYVKGLYSKPLTKKQQQQ